MGGTAAIGHVTHAKSNTSVKVKPSRRVPPEDRAQLCVGDAARQAAQEQRGVGGVQIAAAEACGGGGAKRGQQPSNIVTCSYHVKHHL